MAKYNYYSTGITEAYHRIEGPGVSLELLAGDDLNGEEPEDFGERVRRCFEQSYRAGARAAKDTLYSRLLNYQKIAPQDATWRRAVEDFENILKELK